MSSSSSCPNISSLPSPTPIHATAYLVLYILFSSLTIIGLFSFLYLKQSLGRLKKRSGTLVIASCTGALLAFVVILLREWFSPNEFPCTLLISGHLLSVPVVLGPLVAKLFVHQWRMRRAAVRAALSFAALRREQERIDEEKKEKQTTAGLSALATDVAEFVTLKRSKSKGAMLTAKVDLETGNFEMALPGQPSFRIDEDQEEAPPSKIETRASKSALRKQQQQQSRENDGSRSPTSSPSTNQPGNGNNNNNNNSTPNINNNQRPSTNDSQQKRQSSIGGWFSSPIFTVGLGQSDAEPEIPLKDLLRHESSVFGLVLSVLFSIPSIVSITIRMTTDPTYSSTTLCYGCVFEPQDVYLVIGLLIVILISFFRGAWMVRAAPDPLGVVSEVIGSVSFALLFCGIGFILHLTDPAQMDESRQFAWLTFEAIGMMGVVIWQTYGQIFAAIWSNRLQGNNISLFRVLENTELRILFDHHLAREISIENLRFWDRAVIWKANYAAMDSETRQKYAQELYHVFIQHDAAMPLNLSSTNQRALDQAFYYGAPNVGRDVFDNALREAYKLMKDGLSRFVRTKAFLKSAAKSDFKGDEMRNQEMGLGRLDLDIGEYLAQLSTFNARPSRTDRRVSHMLKITTNGLNSTTNTTSGSNNGGVGNNNNSSLSDRDLGGSPGRRRSTMEVIAGGDDDRGVSRPLSMKLALVADSLAAAAAVANGGGEPGLSSTSQSSLSSVESRKKSAIGTIRKPSSNNTIGSSTIRKPSGTVVNVPVPSDYHHHSTNNTTARSPPTSERDLNV
jgi:hypothetical protein